MYKKVICQNTSSVTARMKKKYILPFVFNALLCKIKILTIK